MTDEVVDPDEREIVREGERLREGEPHEQRSDQAGPRRDGHPVELRRRELRLGERRLDHARHHAHVVTTRELGHDAAVGRVDPGLPVHRARDDLPAAPQHRGRHLVAGALDPEHEPVGGEGVVRGSTGERSAFAHQALRRSRASCSALQSMQSSATGLAWMRLSEICSPQLSHSP